jgi:hypothetical protein
MRSILAVNADLAEPSYYRDAHSPSDYPEGGRGKRWQM